MRISDWSSDVCSSDLGDDRQAEFDRGALCLDLVAHRADMLGLGTDKDDVVRLDDLGEAGVFGQEAIAGMDRVGARHFGRRDDRRDRSEEHTSELQSLLRISFAVFCLKKKTQYTRDTNKTCM